MISASGHTWRGVQRGLLEKRPLRWDRNFHAGLRDGIFDNHPNPLFVGVEDSGAGRPPAQVVKPGRPLERSVRLGYAGQASGRGAAW